jgi:hypothetical protein
VGEGRDCLTDSLSNNGVEDDDASFVARAGDGGRLLLLAGWRITLIVCSRWADRTMQSCLSPGGRADRGNVGGGGAGDKNNSMASAPMVTAALGGRVTRTFGEPDLGNNEGSMVAAVCIVVVVVPGGGGSRQ